ncbi:Rieske (2Fe-2S) protein [Streptomyces sp. DSM 44915]|uniref:Cytochrome bc1 complex Rieske iron-sulfur subunit n=1 Tax=Streptomyces chisholmiae TaxID=3075540 RepID=A0ABU2JL90_9ACTN|nr:Rieske (2Fe-2S) protein [Streptomyces sp. DSM 44915]MDT0265751.1 Rieske (2Fe-2S) protein [Streptomyces sp. DSM 44915]
MNGPVTTRRAAVLAGAAGLAAAALTACGSDDGESNDEDGPSESGGPTESGSDAPESEAPAEGGGEELVATSEVPVGGGTILTDPQVVVTQPTEGEFVAFSSICTHQGCPVSQIAEGAIICTCHNSRFDIRDGSVLEGPAMAPLPAEPITVDGERVLRG